MNDVVISGLGILSPLGINLEAHIDALKAGKCGINFLDPKNASFPVIKGNVPSIKPKDFIKDRKALKYMNKRTILACVATQLAVMDAGLDEQFIESNQYSNAIIYGAGIAEGITNFKEAIVPCVTPNGTLDYQKLGDAGYRQIPPLWVLGKLPNTTASQVSMLYTIKGLNLSVVNGAGSGFVSIGEGYIAIKTKRCSRVFSGGSEGEIYPDFFWRLKEMKVASETEHGSKPFDQQSDGLIPSEGGATVIIEQKALALQRNAKIYAGLVGYANFYVPHFKKAQDMNEISAVYEKCILHALSDAKISPQDIDFIQASSCGYLKIDQAEATAIKNIFKDQSYVTSCFANIGYPLAGSGPIAVAYAALQLKHHFIPPIIRSENFFLKDKLKYVAGAAPIIHRSTYCLINCFDYYGCACSIILKRFENSDE